jgi:enoyl-CoA hydratase
MSYENILFDKKDGIATITFNRPKVLNALNRKTVEELESALLDVRGDTSVRPVPIAASLPNKRRSAARSFPCSARVCSIC